MPIGRRDATNGRRGTTGAARARAAVLALALGGAVAAPGLGAPAVTATDLVREGYQVAWGGYAAITTCRGPRDRYDIGPYVFVCGADAPAYPYHFGPVYLIARLGGAEGAETVSTYLCLEGEARHDPCLKGTVYRRR